MRTKVLVWPWLRSTVIVCLFCSFCAQLIGQPKWAEWEEVIEKTDDSKKDEFKDKDLFMSYVRKCNVDINHSVSGILIEHHEKTLVGFESEMVNPPD